MMFPWYQPFKGPVFLSGIIANAILAFFLLWAVRTGRGARVWLPLVISMVAFGILQGVVVLRYLCIEPQSDEEDALDGIDAIPMVEFELDSSTSSEGED